METKAKKTNLRKEIKSLLKNMPPEQKAKLDHQVFEGVTSLEEFKEAKSVYGYMALPWETGTMEILEYLFENKTPVALPKVLGTDMDFFRVRSLKDLQEGAFHILEPSEACEKVCWPDACMLIPGLAFSLDGKRLGKGGGYYDKFLGREPNHEKIALAYEFQVLDKIPAEEHDQTVNFIVTEKRTIAL